MTEDFSWGVGMNYAKALLISVLVLSACSEKTDLGPLEKRVASLEDSKELADMFVGGESVAFLTPADEGYTLTKADFGNVAVSIENVRDYANGVKLTLKIGNLTTASAKGLSAKIEWGTVDKDGGAQATTLNKQERFTEDLPPGSWKSYQLILHTLSQEKLGFVRVSEIASSSISLSER